MLDYGILFAQFFSNFLSVYFIFQIITNMQGKKSRLTHESSKSFVSSRDSGLRVDFNKNIFFSVDVDLK